MNNQNLLRIATILVGLSIAAMLGWEFVKKQNAMNERQANANPATPGDESSENETSVIKPVLEVGAISQSSEGTIGDRNESSGSSGADSNDGTGLSLRVGVIGSTPTRSEISVIQELPITNSKVRGMYRDSESRTCRMLVPGAPVAPPRTRARAGVNGSFGRIATFTIGLELDFEGRNKLPVVVRGQVEKYLREHRLSVQPILYHDDQGNLYFGTDCQAALYEVDSPSVTVDPEPLIEEAMRRYRALGIVGGSDQESMVKDGTLGRTLAMAFTFEKADRTVTSTSDRGRFVTEMMLLHLPIDATFDDPNIQIFITSDNRMTLHRLDISGESLNSPTPTISADVRFASTVLMGLYPANPIVTRMSYRSDGVVSMESIRQMTLPSKLSQGSGGLSITEVLDQFSALSANRSSSMAGEGSGPSLENGFGSTSDRLDELLERRRQRDGSGLRTGLIPTPEDSIAPTQKPKMMTGLGK